MNEYERLKEQRDAIIAKRRTPPDGLAWFLKASQDEVIQAYMENASAHESLVEHIEEMIGRIAR